MNALFRLCLTAMLTLAAISPSRAADTEEPPLQAKPIFPTAHLLWDPDHRTAQVQFFGGCMSSSIRNLDDTLSARVNADANQIALAGTFRVDDSATLRMMDFGNCLRKTIPLDDLRAGAYVLLYDGKPLQTVTLGPSPLDISIRTRRHLTLKHIKQYFRLGAAPYLSQEQRRLPTAYKDVVGPAIAHKPDSSLLPHVTPDPIVNWFAETATLSVEFGLRCLSPDNLYVGNTTWVELNRKTRTLTVHGDLLFLPWPNASKSVCHGVQPGVVSFSDATPGHYRVMQNEAELFSVTLADTDLTAHRTGIYPMRH